MPAEGAKAEGNPHRGRADGTRSRGDVVCNDLRVHLGSVDNALAKKLLAEYRPIVQMKIRHVAHRARAAFFFENRAELEAVGDAAVLEAYVRYLDDQGTTLRTWIKRVVGWRLADHVAYIRAELPGNAIDRADAHNGALYDHAGDGHAAMHALHRQSVLSWLRGAIGDLTPRQRTIVTAYYGEGETLTAIAMSLGMDISQTRRILHRAIAELRERAERDGIDGAEIGPIDMRDRRLRTEGVP